MCRKIILYVVSLVTLCAVFCTAVYGAYTFDSLADFSLYWRSNDWNGTTFVPTWHTNIGSHTINIDSNHLLLDMYLCLDSGEMDYLSSDTVYTFEGEVRFTSASLDYTNPPRMQFMALNIDTEEIMNWASTQNNSQIRASGYYSVVSNNRMSYKIVMQPLDVDSEQWLFGFGFANIWSTLPSVTAVNFTRVKCQESEGVSEEGFYNAQIQAMNDLKDEMTSMNRNIVNKIADDGTLTRGTIDDMKAQLHSDNTATQGKLDDVKDEISGLRQDQDERDAAEGSAYDDIEAAFDEVDDGDAGTFLTGFVSGLNSLWNFIKTDTSALTLKLPEVTIPFSVAGGTDYTMIDGGIYYVEDLLPEAVQGGFDLIVLFVRCISCLGLILWLYNMFKPQRLLNKSIN